MPFSLEKIPKRNVFKVKVIQVQAPRTKKVQCKIPPPVGKPESDAAALTQDHITSPGAPKTTSLNVGAPVARSLAASPSRKRKPFAEPAAAPPAKRGRFTEEAQKRKRALAQLTESRQTANSKQAPKRIKSSDEESSPSDPLHSIKIRRWALGDDREGDNLVVEEKMEKARKRAEKRVREERFISAAETAPRESKKRADEARSHRDQAKRSTSETPEGKRPGCQQVGGGRHIRYQDLVIEGTWVPVKQLSCDYSGAVWLARNMKDRRQDDIAIKFPANVYRSRLSSHSRKECEAYDKIERAGIQHTVARIFSSWDPDHPQGLYLGMELMDGSASDMKWSGMDGGECDKRASKLVAQIAKVLQAMHNINLVHARLSPASIFYKRTESVDYGVKEERLVWKLGDFRNTQQPFTPVRGRQLPLFMAPELRGPNGFMSNKADVWALHIVMLSLMNWGRYNDKHFALGQQDTNEPRYKGYVSFVRSVHSVDSRATRWSAMASSHDIKMPTMQQVLDRLNETGFLNR